MNINREDNELVSYTDEQIRSFFDKFSEMKGTDRRIGIPGGAKRLGIGKGSLRLVLEIAKRSGWIAEEPTEEIPAETETPKQEISRFRPPSGDPSGYYAPPEGTIPVL